MSAIWGFINLDNIDASVTKGLEMKKQLEFCKIDRYEHMIHKNIFLGCGLQYITEESKLEVLPYYDEDSNILITADVILDNRNELLSLLDIKDNKIPDGKIILESYKKWGEDFTEYLLGDFAFVIIDLNIEKMYMVRDHMGSRCIYYSLNKNSIIFSTLIKPIVACINDRDIVSDKWITEYLSIYNLRNSINCENTVYKNIKVLPPATKLIINMNTNKVKLKSYWNPLRKIKLKYRSDKEYEEAFLKVYNEAVKSRLRGIGDIAIMLSGGLDSSSVACLAAEDLKGIERDIYTYTSIPRNDFKISNNDNNLIFNEKEYVETICSKYKNIKASYLTCDNKNALNTISKGLEILEQPYKCVQNFGWITEVYKKSYENGCKILLSGAFGNFSVSFGRWSTFIKTLIIKGKFIEVYKNIKIYSEEMNISKKALLKYIAKLMCPYKIRKFVSHKITGKKDNIEDSLVNRAMANNFNVRKEIKRINMNETTLMYSSLNKQRKSMFDKQGISYTGELETKLSLYYGILSRDPTKDKRVIEFCNNLPVEQYVKGIEQRSLIRRAFKGIMPEKIRVNTSYGYQSADWIQRLNSDRELFLNEIRELLQDKNMNKYIDINKTNEYLDLIEKKEFWNESNWNEFSQLIRLIVIYRFEKSQKSKGEKSFEFKVL